MKVVQKLKVKKKIIGFILILIMALNMRVEYTLAATEYNESFSYDAISRMKDLNIIDNDVADKDFIINREIFSKAIVVAAGFEDFVNSMNSYSIAADTSDNEFMPYINTAIDRGLMNVMADDNFYPKKQITFAEGCTIMVRALGYSNKDLSGTWPSNYINMAKTLGFTDGITLSKNDGLPLWAAAAMLDRLLETKVKPISSTSQSKYFHEQTGLYDDFIFLEDSSINSDLEDGQILTDKGTYFLPPESSALELGNRYRVKLKDNKIIKVVSKLRETKSLQFADETDYLNVPRNINYYYKGTKQNYINIKDILNENSKMTLVYDDNKTTYEYGVVYNNINRDVETIETIVLGNDKTSDKLDTNQILTNKGLFYYPEKLKFDLGSKYKLLVEGDTVIKVIEVLNATNSYSVDRIIDSTISYYSETGNKSMALPKISSYYYHGVKQEYSTLKNIIKTNSVLILAPNRSKTGYEYGIIIDAVYGNPSINDIFSQDRIPKFINKQVTYEVTDYLGNNSRTLVIYNNITGEITDFTPDKASALNIQLGNKVYEISKYFDLNKLLDLKIGSKVTITLGYDGKIVDIKPM
jgi:hypothetical protein